MALLRDVPTLERELLQAAFGADAVAQMETIGWEETGALYADEGDSIAELTGARSRSSRWATSPRAPIPTLSTSARCA